MSFNIDQPREGARPGSATEPPRGTVPTRRWHHEAIRLKAQGYNESEIARIVGKSQTTLNLFFNPYARKVWKRSHDKYLRDRYKDDPQYRERKIAASRARRAAARAVVVRAADQP